MALDPTQLALLRQLISEPTDANGWTDARIEAIGPGALQSDGTYDMRLYAALVWEAKAADFVELVNVSESGSSRSMSQVFDHATKMAERYRAPAGDSANPALAPPRSTRMVRPTRA